MSKGRYILVEPTDKRHNYTAKISECNSDGITKMKTSETKINENVNSNLIKIVDLLSDNDNNIVISAFQDIIKGIKEKKELPENLSNIVGLSEIVNELKKLKPTSVLFSPLIARLSEQAEESIKKEDLNKIISQAILEEKLKGGKSKKNKKKQRKTQKRM